MLTRITEYCKKFDKRPASFLDNPRIKELIAPDEKYIVMGAAGYTMIDDKHLPEFFLWLSKETRQMVMSGKALEEILQYIKDLP